MDGWDLVGGTSAYQIYENKNWVPMGFAQQYYVTADQLDQVDEDSRAQVLLRAVLLDETRSPPMATCCSLSRTTG